MPEILFDPSLILSPHVFLLGTLLADCAFAAPNLTSPERLAQLKIREGKNQLRLPLKSSLDDVYVFRQAVKIAYGWEISPNQRLTGTQMRDWLKRLGEEAGLLGLIPYNYRYRGANAFNKDGKIASFSTSSSNLKRWVAKSTSRVQGISTTRFGT